MPISLPNIKLTKVKTKVFSLGENQNNLQFPSIFRFIPEVKIIIICLLSISLLSITISQGLILLKNREYLKKITLERNNIEKEVIYWKKLAGNYNNYPDIYLKIASLEYALGNSHSANAFLDKALSLNPNAEQGRVLGEHIRREHY